jgi:hypothetical protein
VSKSHSTTQVTSSNVLDDAKALAGKITDLVGPPPALTKTDISRSLKLRKGGAAMVKTIATLSDQFGLVVPGQPTETMLAKVNQAEDLVALHKQLVVATKHVADAMFQAQSQSWVGATAHYTMLRRLSKMDGSVSKSLAPVTQFFASRSASVQEEEKAARGGAPKGSSKATAHRASVRAQEAAVLANASTTATSASNAPVASAGSTGPSAPQAPTPTNGAAHS